MSFQQQMVSLPMVSSHLVSQPAGADARPRTEGDVSCAWQAAALATYAHESAVGGANLRAELTAQVQALTGCAIPDPDRTIAVDRDARRATVTVDGVVFQLQGHDLLLLRPCAYCGTGRFASPPIVGRADLGYALSGWQPYHRDCEPVDSADIDWE